MRAPTTRSIETDDTGSLISVSDMMAGLLFVFIITLAAFIIRFQDAIDQQDAINDALTSNEAQRSALLDSIKKGLEERGVLVEVDHEHGVLRLKESAIRFDTGRATLADIYQANLETVGEVMASVLPCYTEHRYLFRNRIECDSGISARLDSILIEGHTDNVPIFNNYFKSNWELSTQRAIETYKLLKDAQPVLLDLPNPQGQVLFSVSGYGEGRPVNEHRKPTPDEDNRRIDFRFIMAPPKMVDPQKKLEQMGI